MHENKSIGKSGQVNFMDYIWSIEGIVLNSFLAAVLTDKGITIHTIDPNHGQAQLWQTSFPDEADKYQSITAYTLTENFLIMATTNNSVQYFLLENGYHRLNEIRHDGNISMISSNRDGTRLVVLDDRGKVCALYS